jgi:radical SAM protein with 4Fe4S-binding SPASM domain
MSRIQVNPDNTLWDNFYTQESSFLGTLDDPLESIEEKNLELIMNYMPALKDETCLSCPALGYCWGGCIAGQAVLDKKPSEVCSKELIVPFMKKLADEGRLIDYSHKPKAMPPF